MEQTAKTVKTSVASKKVSAQAGALVSAHIHTAQELGEFIRQYRSAQKILQVDMAGLANTGNRFIVDLEKGKPTLQLQKVLDVLDLIGLEVIVRRKGTK